MWRAKARKGWTMAARFGTANLRWSDPPSPFEQRPERKNGCRVAIFHPKFSDDVLHVFLHGRQAPLQYLGNFPVLFALGDPEQHFRLPVAQTGKNPPHKRWRGSRFHQ